MCLNMEWQYLFLNISCGNKMCLVKQRSPPGDNKVKISKSYILKSPPQPWHVMSVKCEQHLDEFTVHVWLLYDHPNLKYYTLYVSRTELATKDPDY